jgi:hypothetical protein
MSDLRDWEITYGADDYRLRVYTYKRWPRFVAAFTDRTMAILGHPCCGRGIGKVEAIGASSNRLLSKAHSYEYTHEVLVLDLTVSEDEAFMADPRTMELRNDLRYD